MFPQSWGSSLQNMGCWALMIQTIAKALPSKIPVTERDEKQQPSPHWENTDLGIPTILQFDLSGEGGTVTTQESLAVFTQKSTFMFPLNCFGKNYHCMINKVFYISF